MRKRIQVIFLMSILLTGSVRLLAQSDINDYKKFDFVPGEIVLLDDNLVSDKTGSTPLMWNVEGGKATIGEEKNEKYISINEYYTKLSPKIKNALPDTFTIEYDTWLDAGYDGNPGVEILLLNGEQQVVITPNKHALSVYYPNDGHETKDNPEVYFGEDKFYNRWVHISIACIHKHLTVYLDQYKQIDIADCRLRPEKLLLTGNTSQEMKILFKNFRLAKSIPGSVSLQKGKFITHAIKFDVNKAVVKPESMHVINELVAYLKANTGAAFEIGGYTDSDGDDAFNVKLSQERADAVKTLLVSLGVSENSLTAKGYGETMPIDNNTTAEGKANNRRVEFVKK
jgi:OmpA-OmpF porin, OOP family